MAYQIILDDAQTWPKEIKNILNDHRVQDLLRSYDYNAKPGHYRTGLTTGSAEILILNY